MDVTEIVKKYLEDNGYDGLYRDDDGFGCGCGKDNLFLCANYFFPGDCQPAYRCRFTDDDGEVRR